MYAHPATQANVARLRDAFGYRIVEPESRAARVRASSGAGRLADLPADRGRGRGRRSPAARSARPSRVTTARRSRSAPRGRPRRPPRRRDRRRHGRADRPGPLHRQPLDRQDGGRHRRGRPGARRGGDPHRRPHVSVPLPGRRTSRPGRVHGRRCEPPLLEALDGPRRRGRASTCSSWPPPSPTSGRAGPPPTEARPRRRADARARADAGHPGRGRPAAFAGRRERCSDRPAARAPADPGRLRRRDRLARARRRRSCAARASTCSSANDVAEPGSGFGTDTNRVTILAAGRGRPTPWPLLTKREVADRLLDRVVLVLGRTATHSGSPTSDDRAGDASR